LSDDDVLINALLLQFAGQGTTTGLIGSAALHLALDFDMANRLRSAPELLPGAIEEVARLEGPTATAAPRFTVEDVSVGGVRIPAGEHVIFCFASANRDPERYTDPAALLPERPERTHLGFGHGTHSCAGVPLARIQAATAVRVLLDDVPDIALSVPRGEVRWLPQGLRTPHTLPVIFNPR
jgi:cytochrome P450